jgi:ankyrin repeat protein
MYASDKCFEESLAFLIEYGADVKAVDNEGRTALFYAVKNNKGGNVDLLVKNGADINARDVTGKTVLFYAIENVLIVKNVFFNKNRKLKTRIERNIHTGKEYERIINSEMNIIKFLVENGADINAEDGTGETALSYAKGANIGDALIAWSRKENFTPSSITYYNNQFRLI